MLFLLLLALASPRSEGNETELRNRTAAQPRAIRQFVERRAMCNHWGGEEPYDSGRRRQIEQAMRDLGCATLSGEETFLLRYFANHPDTARLIEDSRDESGWVADPQESD